MPINGKDGTEQLSDMDMGDINDDVGKINLDKGMECDYTECTGNGRKAYEP